MFLSPTGKPDPGDLCVFLMLAFPVGWTGSRPGQNVYGSGDPPGEKIHSYHFGDFLTVDYVFFIKKNSKIGSVENM